MAQNVGKTIFRLLRLFTKRLKIANKIGKYFSRKTNQTQRAFMTIKLTSLVLREKRLKTVFDAGNAEREKVSHFLVQIIWSWFLLVQDILVSFPCQKVVIKRSQISVIRYRNFKR